MASANNRQEDTKLVTPFRDYFVATVFTLVVFAWQCIAPVAAAPLKQTPRSQLLKGVESRHSDLKTIFQADLTRLSDEATAQNLTGLVEEISRLQVVLASVETVYTRPPRDVEASLPLTMPEQERALRVKYQTLRNEYSKALYKQAEMTLKGNLASVSYVMLLEIVRVSPDHADARRILGYELYRQKWVTPFERRMIEDNLIDDPRFGWIHKDDVDRYHSGERRYASNIPGFAGKGKWLPEDRDNELRRDFRYAWEVRTANFLVKTNHSLEKGVEISRALEDFHEYFRFLFAGFYTTPQQIQALFRGGQSGRALPSSQLYVVHYYANKDEYVRTLINKIPMVAQTNGIYMQDDKIAYFYHDPNDASLAPMYHEATHQLFYESQQKHRKPGNLAHFWIIEGIACYMESFERSADGQSFSTGNPNYVRFVNARQNLAVRNVFLPFEMMDQMGQYVYQQATLPVLQQRYSQSTGMAHFFMHYNEGEYRDALVNHISQLYSSMPRVAENPDTLDRLTETSFGELDQAYRSYCLELDRQLALDEAVPRPTHAQ
ncbi:DUF1570 domain-containing protein [Lacunimicrobium album]